MNKPALNLNVGQGLSMTPSLRQAIELLNMPMAELNTFVEKELMENPCLTSDDGTAEADNALSGTEGETRELVEEVGQALGEGEAPLDYDWENMYEGTSTPASKSAESNSTWEQTAHEGITLQDVLREQFHVVTLDPVLNFLGNYLIDAADDSGYIRLNLAETAKQLGTDLEKLEDALAIIQTFEPAGVGARDLAECLRLQLHASDDLTDVADVVLNNLELMARRDLKKLAKLANCNEQALLDTFADIADCTPKPGLVYGSGNASAVLPDLVVTGDKAEGTWKVELNAEAMPKVLLNQSAAGLLAGGKASKSKDSDKSYATERMSRAKWLVNSLEQRARTILKVGRAIVAAQGDFFTYGIESLKPLTLKDIATIIEMHESTVSRVTNGKYMQTPMGVFELKYFFSAGIGTTGGNMEVAAASVKAMIKRLIEAEDAKKPISDDALVTLLKGEGVAIARRTVAKYRESLGIPSSSGRRVR